MNHILIVEDELPISILIKMNLTEAGYSCFQAFDGETVISILKQQVFDLILLDIMLPKLDGYELMKYIKPLDIPVIFLTAKSDVLDRVKGLKLGADDYLTKPFEIIELLARVETVLRRYNKKEEFIEIDTITIYILSRVVKKKEKIINLTVKEYDLLLFFIQNKGIALSRDKIYEHVWGESFMGDSRTVDLHVQRIRKKLGWENKITAVYKIGYRLEI